MSVKNNIVANYVGRFYVALIGIAIVPYYLVYLGKESYGLVAIYTMMQGWMQLLDVGLSTTIAREAACYKAGQYSGGLFRKLFYKILVFFITVGVLVGFLGVLGAETIANEWLNIEGLQISDVVFCISMMVISLVFRWGVGPFRSVILGFERQILLNSINVIFATARFVLVLPVMKIFGSSVNIFFIWQLAVCVMEFAVFCLVSIRILPKEKKVESNDFEKLMKPVLSFSLKVAFTSGIWVIITQLDKLVLSKILPLSEYGVFTMAVMAASGIMILSVPISQAILPRLTNLKARGDVKSLQELYSLASQFISVIVTPASMILAFFSEQVVYVWTGDSSIAKEVSPLLFWYSLGNGLLSLSSFPYYLQYAYGDLKLHVYGNVVFAITLIPSVVYAAYNYGAVGAAIVWFSQNFIYLFIWTWVVHNKFLPKGHLRWLRKDVMPMLCVSLILSYSASQLGFLGEEGRIKMLFALVIMSLSLLFINSLFSESIRNKYKKILGV